MCAMMTGVQAGAAESLKEWSMGVARRVRIVGSRENAETRRAMDQLFARYWDDVAPLNSYTPETAQALLARESDALEQRLADSGVVELSNAVNDPWLAVKLGLRERAAGRPVTRHA